MKLLVSFVLLFTLLDVLNATPIHSDSPYVQKMFELVYSEKPSTNAGLHSIGCFSWYCHFDDKNGCRKECNKFGELVVNIHANKATYLGTDAKLCVKDCMNALKDGSESEKVCSNLCVMEVSHPEREKWVQLVKETLPGYF